MTAVQLSLAATAFLPNQLKEGTVDPSSDKTVLQQLQEMPEDIEALDLMLKAYDFHDKPDWTPLKRFKKLKRLELGGPDFALTSSFCELYSLPIESLYVRADTIDREVTRQMYKLNGLKQLGLIIPFEYKQDSVHLVDLAKIKSLEELKTSGSRLVGIGELIQCPHLKRIELGEADDSHAIQYSKLKQVQQLCMEGAGSALPEGSHPLATKGLDAIARMPNLKYLDLSSQNLTDDILAALSKCNSLEVLNLSNNPITDRGIAHLRSLSNLKALKLSLTKITDEGFASLSDLKKLEELDFSGTHTSGAGMKYLKGLPLRHVSMAAISNGNLAFLAGLPSLNYLDLGSATISDTGAKHLAKCSNLVWLVVGKLQDQKEKAKSILQELATMKNLKKLEGLYDDSLQKEIATLLPNCASGSLPSQTEEQMKSRIRDDNSHDITKSFSCFR